MHPLRFCYHLVRRLCFWVYTPTGREKMHAMFELGKVAGRTEALKALPIARVQPVQIAGVPMPLLSPIRQRDARRRALSGVTLLPKGLWDGSPTTEPIRPLGREETEKYRAMPRFLRER